MILPCAPIYLWKLDTKDWSHHCYTKIIDSALAGMVNSTIQLLDGQYWDDWAPTLTTPTKPPVCSRHLAILWSLEKRNKGWGEERRRGDWKGRNWVRWGGCGIGSRLWVPQRKIWWLARWNSLPRAIHLLPLLLHFSLGNLLQLLLLLFHQHLLHLWQSKLLCLRRPGFGLLVAQKSCLVMAQDEHHHGTVRWILKVRVLFQQKPHALELLPAGPERVVSHVPRVSPYLSSPVLVIPSGRSFCQTRWWLMMLDLHRPGWHQWSRQSLTFSWKIWRRWNLYIYWAEQTKRVCSAQLKHPTLSPFSSQYLKIVFSCPKPGDNLQEPWDNLQEPRDNLQEQGLLLFDGSEQSDDEAWPTQRQS